VEFKGVLRRLLAGEGLSQQESAILIGEIMDGGLSPIQAAGLFTALAAKGESVDEIAGAARAMRDRSLRVAHDLPVVADIVGTGGDGADTINISTMAALIVAAAGVPVAKHGNRAASSTCGSADVLEAAGLDLDVPPERAAKALARTGFAFLFAPRYHPAMKYVAPVRRELGVRTIFNVLGPLTNPARATHQVVGVARPELLEPVGAVLRELGTQAGAVVHGPGGIDEIGGEGVTQVASFDAWGPRRWTLDPADFGVRASRADIAGGSLRACSDAFGAILGGEASPRADVVALNAALALHLCGSAPSMRDAFELARSVQRSGKALLTFVASRGASNG
jgi:anthranilate phosphoribosyltransferase